MRTSLAHARGEPRREATALDLAPDEMLPAQLDGLRRSAGARTPEQRLMLAVLEDAVHAYQIGCNASEVGSLRLHREAAEWVASDETTSPFSFVTICEVFGLDPDWLRGGLRRWAARRPGSPLRIRRISGSRHRVTTRRREPLHRP